MKIKIEYEISDDLVETIVRGIMENFPEASGGMSLGCTYFNYDHWKFTFRDYANDETIFCLDKAKLLATFPLLFTEKWPKGCTPIPSLVQQSADVAAVWDDWLCQCDAIDCDAFVQLACFGEVIYG